MIKWPIALIDDLARRRCVIFIGSGVSCNSVSTIDATKRPLDWKTLLTKMCESVQQNKRKSVLKMIKDGEFLSACDAIKRLLRPDEYKRLLDNEFSSPRYNSAEIHKHIFNLDSRIVVTPNFDTIYETYAREITKGDVKVKLHKEYGEILDSIRTHKYTIVKMHGSIDATDELIFTQRQYSEARIKYSFFYEILSALAITHTFFFIGCGQNDPDVRMLFEDNFFKYRCSQPHYFTIAKQASNHMKNQMFEELLNMRLLEYSPDNGHKELTESIEDLVKQVDLKRADLSATTKW